MTNGLFHCERFNCRLAPQACAKRRRLKDSLGRAAFPECVGCEKARKPAPAKAAEGSLPSLGLVQGAVASLDLATFHVLMALSRLGEMLGKDDGQRAAVSELLEHVLGLSMDDGLMRVATRLAEADPLLLAAASTSLPGLFRVDVRAIEENLPLNDAHRELLRRMRLEKDRRLKLLQVLLQKSQPR